MKLKQARKHCSIRHLLRVKDFIRLVKGLVLITLLLIQVGYAATSGKLYESSIKVEPGKSENDLIAAAFTHVLVKVSGRSEVVTSSAYKTMLEKAKGAILQFRYDYKNIPPADGSSPAEGSEKKADDDKEKWFWVRFNPETINSLLKEAHLPVWGSARPATLVWFSQETQGQRRLQSQYEAPQIYDLLKQQAEYRGIALMFPFLDLQDQASVSVTDIWGNFNDAILLASRRYQAQATVTIRLYKEPGDLWVSQWTLLILGNVQSWEIRDEKVTRIMASGIDELANKLARKLSRSVGDRNEDGILVQINNVSDFKAFQELDDYLRNLATVKSLALLDLRQDRVIYKISYQGDKGSFIQEIRLGNLLNSVERSQVDYGNLENENKDYKSVILDGLETKDKSGVEQGQTIITPEPSAREKALTAMDSGQQSSTQPDTKKAGRPADTLSNSPANSDSKAVDSTSSKNLVRKLIPELEYWLIR